MLGIPLYDLGEVSPITVPRTLWLSVGFTAVQGFLKVRTIL